MRAILRFLLDSVSSDAPSQVGQRQTATQQDTYMATQGCSCSWCSATRHDDQPVWRTMEYQNPWPPAVCITQSDVAVLSSDFGPPKDPVIPFTNQVLGAGNHPTGTAAMMNAQPQAQLVAPQVYVCTVTVVLCCHIMIPC
jgi:hypothetical protein